jgi:hypothetical protein
VHMRSANPVRVTEPLPERRVINRVHTAIPLTIKLVGEAGAPPPLTVQTTNISPRGMSTVLIIRIKEHNGRFSIHEETKGSAKMVKYLLSEDRIVGLGIHILPQGGSIHAMGTVRWYASSVSKRLYALRLGIFLDEVDRTHKQEWFGFLRAIYQHLACFYPEMEDAKGSMPPLYPD